MNEQQQLQLLEQRVEELLGLSAQLRQENQVLQSREVKLLEERAELLKKNDMARAKVEAIITRLKSLEQEP